MKSVLIMGWEIGREHLSRKDLEKGSYWCVGDEIYVGKIMSSVCARENCAELAFDQLLLTELRQQAYRSVFFLEEYWHPNESPTLFHLFIDEEEKKEMKKLYAVTFEKTIELEARDEEEAERLATELIDEGNVIWDKIVIEEGD